MYKIIIHRYGKMETDYVERGCLQCTKRNDGKRGFSKFMTVRMYLVIYAQIIEIVEFCAYD